MNTHRYRVEAYLSGGAGMPFYEGKVDVVAGDDTEAIEIAKRKIRHVHGNRPITITAVVRREGAADVANFAMMIADVSGGLKPAPSPAPPPAEVEAAMDFIEDLLKATACHDLETPCDICEQNKKALATIRAALTEARQPKRVSREWVARFAMAENAYDWLGVGRLLGELGLTVEEPK